jgi:hypothetical protein
MAALEALNQAVVDCRRCPRLVEWRERVAREKRAAFRDWDYWGRPMQGFGDPDARVLILGLAPAAHGGNRTGRIFTGDRSGEGDVSVLHRYNRGKHRDERVAGEIPRAASGFGYDAGAAYYAVPQQAGQIGCVTGRDCPTDIHRVDGLTFEKAPPIELH